MLRSRTRCYHEVNWTLCYNDLNQKPGSRLNKKTVLPCKEIDIIKITRSDEGLVFIMGDGLYTETGSGYKTL